MSLEAMETLSAVEERLKKQKADAQTAARTEAAKAREDGEQLLTQARKKADDEIAELLRQTDGKAKEAADKLSAESRDDRENLRARAQTKEEEAISFVVERIVNG